MPSKINKIIIDTNLWISFLITKDYTKLDELIYNKRCVLIFSQELLDEFLEVANRPKFRRFFALDDITELVETINEFSELVEVKSIIKICRDPKDNFLLALAKDSHAHFLITGDEDLLSISKFEKTKIISITKFLKQ